MYDDVEFKKYIIIISIIATTENYEEKCLQNFRRKTWKNKLLGRHRCSGVNHIKIGVRELWFGRVEYVEVLLV